MIEFLKKHSYILLFLWMGFVLAISFMEAPLKFTSDKVDTSIGVSIGRIVFKALNTVEIVLLILYTVLTIMNKMFKRNVMLYGLLSIVAIQTFILLPYLDERALAIINGLEVPASNMHLYYVILEICKVVILGWLGIQQIQQQSTVKHD